MLRRTRAGAHWWASGAFTVNMPKGEGPPPSGAPQNMNGSKSLNNVDTVDDSFPRSIRGDKAGPNIPTKFEFPSWFFMNTTREHAANITPWTMEGPEDAFRFRPFNEFDRVGRTEAERFHRTAASPNGIAKEAYLSRMHESSAAAVEEDKRRRAPTPATVMDRAMKQYCSRIKHKHPTEIAFDAGRSTCHSSKRPATTEAVASSNGEANPRWLSQSEGAAKGAFPFQWGTEDWYEYEIADARLKRFFIENKPTGDRSSEVTYKLILSGSFDHHAARFAEDVAAFARDVGRQVMEERLIAVRRQMEALAAGSSSVIDDRLRAAFNLHAAGPDQQQQQHYDDDEIAHFALRELRALERAIVRCISLANAAMAVRADWYQEGTVWPHVEQLQPWKKMIEMYSRKGHGTFGQYEDSTRKYEFEEFYRVVVIKMPFASPEFEKRLNDIRLWAHRDCGVQHDTVYRRNMVHDLATFRTERDPEHKTDHEHHSLFSFALDWEQAPAALQAVATVRDGDTWEAIAGRLGTTVPELKAANRRALGVEKNKQTTTKAKAKASQQQLDVVLPGVGATLRVPPLATRRTTTNPQSQQQILSLAASEGSSASPTAAITSWAKAATALGCTVEELQIANGAAAADYDTKADAFGAKTKALIVPASVADVTEEAAFSATEPVFRTDTLAAVAARVGTTVEKLIAANPETLGEIKADSSDKADLSAVLEVQVPTDAKRPRRRHHPLERASSDELFPTMQGEHAARALPEDGLPRGPQGQLHQRFGSLPTHFKEEKYPPQPTAMTGEESWLAYTATYLDPELSTNQEPAPAYNVNPVWPMQQVPGTEDQTPFEEDQTWQLHQAPMQSEEPGQHPDGWIQDMKNVNNEQFSKSLEWHAP